MSPVELTPEQKHQNDLAKRRMYYSANKEAIRKRDNAAAAKKRKAEPERFRGYQVRYKKKQAGKPKRAKRLVDSPDFMRIVYAIMEEDKLISAK